MPFTPFDLLVVMLVSEAAGPPMTGDEHSIWGGLLVCLVLIGIEQALREADCGLAALRYAFLEADGSVSIQKRRPQSNA